ncbi:MAG: EamA family transporter [Bacteroidota bacterium]
MKPLNIKWAYLLALSVIWGSSFILIKKSLLGLSAFQLGSLRTIFTGLILFAAGFGSLKYIPKEKWKWLALSGFLGSFFPSYFFAIAETEIDSAVASILNSLVPLNTILIGFFLFKISSTRRQIFGVVIGFLGTILLILKGAELNPKQNYWFAGFVIASTLMYATNTNIIKKHLQDVKPIAIATANYVFIVIPAFAILAFDGFFKEATLNNEYLWESLGYVFILSLLGTALAKIFYNKLVQISTPVFASSVTYLMPVIALGWGLLDGETFGLLQLGATSLILFGVYLSHRKKKT